MEGTTNETRTFRWNDKREQAALLVAEGRLSDVQIVRCVGVSKQTLDYWKRRPEFEDRVAAYGKRLGPAAV